MALATVSDVETRMLRPLTTEETALANVLLDDVERRLLRRVPTLLTDLDLADAAVSVEAAAVARVLKNSDGFRTESDGDYSFSRYVEVASGYLFILDSEWGDLGVASSGAWTIDPQVAAVPSQPDVWTAASYPWGTS